MGRHGIDRSVFADVKDPDGLMHELGPGRLEVDGAPHWQMGFQTVSSCSEDSDVTGRLRTAVTRPSGPATTSQTDDRAAREIAKVSSKTR
jgi:hypothetical protein